MIRREVQTAEEIATLKRHDAAKGETINTLTRTLAENTMKLTDLYAEMNVRVAKIQGHLGVE
jgi:hypothetical protein